MQTPACCTSDDTDLQMYYYSGTVGRETGRLQYATAKACVERAAFFLNEMAAVGTHEESATIKDKRRGATITNFPFYFRPRARKEI